MSNTTIAFTSCFDAEKDASQEVWSQIRNKNPDALLLLGDTVYMDWGLFGKRKLGWPQKNEIEDSEFLETLYQRYKKQWSVKSFRDLVRSNVKIGMTWDDHDFAWNNSRGRSNVPENAVTENQRRISRGLFLQFNDCVNTKRSEDNYPHIPTLSELKNTEDIGIYDSFDVNDVRVVMLDGRSFREDPNEISTWMHGKQQLEKLLDDSNSIGAQPLVIGAGSVLLKSSGMLSTFWKFLKSIFGIEVKESWDFYKDYEYLLQNLNTSKAVVLTGDVHANRKPFPHLRIRTPPPSLSPLYEITSSGAARPGVGGNSGNFGLLTLGSENKVELFTEKNTHGETHRLAL